MYRNNMLVLFYSSFQA